MPPPTNALAPQSPNTLLEPREMSQQEFISGLLPPLAIPMGISAGMRQQLEGSVQGALDPVGTVKNIYQSIVKYSRNPQEALEAMRAVRQQLMSGPFAAAQMMAGAIPMPGSMRGGSISQITEPPNKFKDLWHGSPNPAFEKFDPTVKGEFSRMPALGPGSYIGVKPYAEGFAGDAGSLTKWEPTISKSLYFDDESFTPNTPRANAANRQAFEAVKKVDPDLAHRVFAFDKGKIKRINRAKLSWDENGKPFNDYSDFVRAMDIAGIDSVVDIAPNGSVHQVMVRNPANLKRVD